MTCLSRSGSSGSSGSSHFRCVKKSLGSLLPVVEKMPTTLLPTTDTDKYYAVVENYLLPYYRQNKEK